MLAIALGVLSGCGPDPVQGVCRGELGVEAGTAPYDEPETFVALQGEEMVTMVMGAQGGFHIWQSLRARGVESTCQVARRVERADGLVLFDNRPGDRFHLETGESYCELEQAQPSFVSACDAHDQDVFLEVEVDDGARIISDRVRVHVTCPPLGTDDGNGNDAGEVCLNDC